MATGQMVLCVGQEVVTVYIDAKGKPTAPPHACPDCVISLAASNAPSPISILRNISPVEFAAMAMFLRASIPGTANFDARAPPTFA